MYEAVQLLLCLQFWLQNSIKVITYYLVIILIRFISNQRLEKLGHRFWLFVVVVSFGSFCKSSSRCFGINGCLLSKRKRHIYFQRFHRSVHFVDKANLKTKTKQQHTFRKSNGIVEVDKVAIPLQYFLFKNHFISISGHWTIIDDAPTVRKQHTKLIHSTRDPGQVLYLLNAGEGI